MYKYYFLNILYGFIKKYHAFYIAVHFERFEKYYFYSHIQSIAFLST